MPVATLWPLPGPVVASPPSATATHTGARLESDYLAALQTLLPQGRAWPRDSSATLTAVLDGWARCYSRVDARQTNLLVDAFPTSAIELLPEWELTLGLPDPCLGAAPTLQQRQTQVRARLIAQGGQSVPYLTAFAVSLGFPVTITEFAPFRAGSNRAGDRVNGSQPPTPGSSFSAGIGAAGQPIVTWVGGTNGFDWSQVLRVTATVEPTEYFSAGRSAAGEPIISAFGSSALGTIHYFTAGVDHAGSHIVSWGAPLLECELPRIAPAQSVVTFAYGA